MYIVYSTKRKRERETERTWRTRDARPHHANERAHSSAARVYKAFLYGGEDESVHGEVERGEVSAGRVAGR